MPRRVLVTGATGQQGGATVSALLKQGVEVCALSRSPGSDAAKALEARGVTVFRGDFEDPASLEQALKDAQPTQVFLVTDFWVAAKQDEDTEVRHGVNFIDAVAKVDASLFLVYTSVGDADNVPAEVHHFCSKARVEKHLAQTLKNWAVVRPVTFLDNLDAPGAMNPLTKGHVKMLIAEDLPMKYVATHDIGVAAANVLAQPSMYKGKVMELATCEHTGLELAEALTAASGTPCKYSISMPSFLQWLLVRDLYHMVQWFESDGYSADVAAGRKLVGPGALDAQGWFARKGQWANGRQFGEPDPPLCSLW